MCEKERKEKGGGAAVRGWTITNKQTNKQTQLNNWMGAETYPNMTATIPIPAWPMISPAVAGSNAAMTPPVAREATATPASDGVILTPFALYWLNVYK